MPYGREDEGDEGFSKDDSDCDKMKRWMTGCYLIWAAFDEGLFEGDSDRDGMKRWRRDVISYTVFARKWKYVLIAREWKDEWQDFISYSHTHCVLHSVCDEMRRWMTRCHLIHSICEEMKRCIDC